MSVLNRFRAVVLNPVCVSLSTIPSGYVQAIEGSSIPSPLMVNQDPSVGAFIRLTGFSVDTRDSGFVPMIADGAIGRFVIGVGRIGGRNGTHGPVSSITAPGFDGTGSFQIAVGF